MENNPLSPFKLRVLTVAELSGALKHLVEESFSYVRVRGEISGFKHHTSGHVYFSLKDEDALISGVCWRPIYQSFSLKLEDGMDIIATGRITLYTGRSQYQLVLEKVELAGRGALLKLLEERKEKLSREGIFNQEHKKQLPFFPRVIGVITSPTGAVIQDILHRLQERFPVHVLLWPVRVQGEGAESEIEQAILGFNAIHEGSSIPKPELLIVARGGGSFEDLMPFNEESVIRAVFKSDIPLISAVGHETDVTLLDFVADKRAPTPTAAAEMATPVRQDLLTSILDHYRRLLVLGKNTIIRADQYLTTLTDRLGHPKRFLEQRAQRLDDLSEGLTISLEKRILMARVMFFKLLPRFSAPKMLIQKEEDHVRLLEAKMSHGIKSLLNQYIQDLKSAELLLEMTSYTKILDRGFVLVRDVRTHLPLTSVTEIHAHQEVSLTFKDGERGALMQEI